jgi:hypothetical protein
MGLGTTITVVVGIAGLGLGAMEVPEIHDRVFTPKRSEVKRVVTLLDSSLGEAAKGRTTMITVNKSVNNCWPKTTPATAAETVRKLVRKNRAFVRAEVSSIGPTTDSDAQELVDAFREAYTRSERVDQDYETGSALGTSSGTAVSPGFPVPPGTRTTRTTKARRQPKSSS